MVKNKSNHGTKSFDNQYYRRFFDQYTKKEFDIYYRWSLGWANFLNRYLPLANGNGKKVLEIGCSAGYFAKILHERGFNVIATDVSDYIIRKAKKLHKEILFQKLDVAKKINIKGKFDYIFAFEVLEHLEYPEKALRNVAQKLKKSGVFVFSTPFPTKRSLADPTHINVHDEEWWLRLGKKVGFKRTRLMHATFIPFLYRFSSIFSVGYSIKTNIPFVNSTAFFVFEK